MGSIEPSPPPTLIDGRGHPGLKHLQLCGHNFGHLNCRVQNWPFGPAAGQVSVNSQLLSTDIQGHQFVLIQHLPATGIGVVHHE